MPEGSTHRQSISCELLRQTEKAWLIDDGSYTLFAEDWILKEKGLI